MGRCCVWVDIYAVAFVVVQVRIRILFSTVVPGYFGVPASSAAENILKTVRSQIAYHRPFILTQVFQETLRCV